MRYSSPPARRALAKSDTEWFDDATDLMGKKKYAEAAAAFRESVKADPRYKEAWQGLADALKAQGKTEAAARAQKQADEAKAVRAGNPPPLTEEQKKALAEDAPATKESK